MPRQGVVTKVPTVRPVAESVNLLETGEVVSVPAVRVVSMHLLCTGQHAHVNNFLEEFLLFLRANILALLR